MPAASPTDLDVQLRHHFQLRAFREGQRDVIEALLAGRSTLAVMPTGRGKSLCYQLPALMLPGVTMVVSPLIALMKDQVDTLTDRGIAATFINSSLDGEEQQRRIEGLRAGTYKLVYVAPERFRQRAFVETLRDVQVSLFAVDEAHCLSQWGHDFRPDYLKLRAAREACGNPVVLAATATATAEVRDDIVHQLGLEDPKVVVSGFDRPNLRYVVRYAPSEDAKAEKLQEILEKMPGSAIVYAATRKNVENVTERLNAAGIAAVAYHAGLEDLERAGAQDAFMSDRVRVVVATNAFGMGIDKPDVRLVVHHDLPGTIEAYYQEAGRAGRDGRTAFCVLLFSPADRYLQEFFIEGACPRPETIAGVYQVLAAREEEEIFVSQEALNRQLPHKAHDMAVGTALTLLERAGLIARLARGTAVSQVRLLVPDAQAPRSSLQQKVLDRLRATPGSTAGRSLELGPFADSIEEAREAVHHALQALRMKAVIEYTPPARTRGMRVTRRVADPLLDLDLVYLESKQARELAKLDRMVGFAYARRCRRDAILDYFGEQTARPCGKCDVCMGQADPALDNPGGGKATTPRPQARGGARPGDEQPQANPLLYDTLVALRSRMARLLDVPAYMIFGNASLREMATYLPDCFDAMLAVHGVGKEKLAKYGSEFLGAIIAYREMHPEAAPIGAPKPLSKKKP